MPLNKLMLRKVNDLVYALLTENGDHVGNLKRINADWKFKAIGYDVNGDVLPGGGPLTDQHNMRFADLDESVISARLLGDLKG
jgi:hypothetical protein